MKEKKNNIIVFYDSWCPICTKVKNNIEKLDWFNQIQLISIRSENINHIEIPLKELEKSMHCKFSTNNRTVSGIEAIAAIVIRLPLLAPLWPIIKLSSLLGIGQWLYNRIATTRKIIPVNNCEGSSCKIK
ncbi:TPA: thiol-disulfide oxidoreductase DCC family protein [Bacillus cereus]